MNWLTRAIDEAVQNAASHRWLISDIAHGAHQCPRCHWYGILVKELECYPQPVDRVQIHIAYAVMAISLGHELEMGPVAYSGACRHCGARSVLLGNWTAAVTELNPQRVLVLTRPLAGEGDEDVRSDADRGLRAGRHRALSELPGRM